MPTTAAASRRAPRTGPPEIPAHSGRRPPRCGLAHSSTGGTVLTSVVRACPPSLGRRERRPTECLASGGGRRGGDTATDDNEAQAPVGWRVAGHGLGRHALVLRLLRPRLAPGVRPV